MHCKYVNINDPWQIVQEQYCQQKKIWFVKLTSELPYKEDLFSEKNHF